MFRGCLCRRRLDGPVRRAGGGVRPPPGRHFRTRVGLPRARNLGIGAARGEVLAFTDVDTTPDARWLEAGLRRFDEDGAEFLAGAIAVPIGQRPSIAALVDATTFFDQESYVIAGFAAGANVWVRRSVVERFGGFNEALERYGGDDEEFGYRLTGAGVRLMHAPEVLVTHPPRRRLRDMARKAFRLGYSQAARRRVPAGSLSGTIPLYRRPSNYLPKRRLQRLVRVAALAYEPTIVELLKMHAARYVCVQLAGLAGDYAGERMVGR
ncbi:MAG TPA: glycosyltransferase [Solirubrobacteraceae bacterium]|nr:glycosyltransferase [Solirubrobacteraceae bacterium]